MERQEGFKKEEASVHVDQEDEEDQTLEDDLNDVGYYSPPHLIMK